MIKKVLIANRSEIACRVIKACRETGISTVAVYSEADRGALHVRLADEAVLIGPAPAAESYLNMDAVIKAALETACDAIHPGYGFLSENHEFNKKVRDAGLIFIGPNPEAMAHLGSKVASRKTVMNADVPVVPGMKGSSTDINEFIKAAEDMEYPVLIKASAGGGGKGMRVVQDPAKLAESVESAMRESKSAFGSDEVFLEKYIVSPRHVEIQVACDSHGNAVYLFERECSIQRRHQKIIEESPSPVMTPELRKKMGEAAIRVVKAVGYDNLGTVEFLVDKGLNFYFLEVNARIQVEHPVTEEVTGIDLVKLQIEIADGGEIPFKQEDLSQRGHAIECRIYAESADRGFLPSSGKLLYLKEPAGPGVRFDSGVSTGVNVPVFYDPVLAKLITRGADREEARQRMVLALRDTAVLGVETSIDFMIQCLEHDDYIQGKTFTDFIDKNIDQLKRTDDDGFEPIAAIAAAVRSAGSRPDNGQASPAMVSPWLSVGKWEIASDH
ncbi:MAG: acetyl/propionyl/methylcrotonyl-CoA carboxylase subunit alpha [Candidatus Kapaibacterium sp.]